MADPSRLFEEYKRTGDPVLEQRLLEWMSANKDTTAGRAFRDLLSGMGGAQEAAPTSGGDLGAQMEQSLSNYGGVPEHAVSAVKGIKANMAARAAGVERLAGSEDTDLAAEMARSERETAGRMAQEADRGAGVGKKVLGGITQGAVGFLDPVNLAMLGGPLAMGGVMAGDKALQDYGTTGKVDPLEAGVAGVKGALLGGVSKLAAPLSIPKHILAMVGYSDLEAVTEGAARQMAEKGSVDWNQVLAEIPQATGTGIAMGWVGALGHGEARARARAEKAPVDPQVEQARLEAEQATEVQKAQIEGDTQVATEGVKQEAKAAADQSAEQTAQQAAAIRNGFVSGITEQTHERMLYASEQGVSPKQAAFDAFAEGKKQLDQYLAAGMPVTHEDLMTGWDAGVKLSEKLSKIERDDIANQEADAAKVAKGQQDEQKAAEAQAKAAGENAPPPPPNPNDANYMQAVKDAADSTESSIAYHKWEQGKPLSGTETKKIKEAVAHVERMKQEEQAWGPIWEQMKQGDQNAAAQGNVGQGGVGEHPGNDAGGAPTETGGGGLPPGSGEGAPQGQEGPPPALPPQPLQGVGWPGPGDQKQAAQEFSTQQYFREPGMEAVGHEMWGNPDYYERDASRMPSPGPSEAPPRPELPPPAPTPVVEPYVAPAPRVVRYRGGELNGKIRRVEIGVSSPGFYKSVDVVGTPAVEGRTPAKKARVWSVQEKQLSETSLTGGYRPEVRETVKDGLTYDEAIAFAKTHVMAPAPDAGPMLHPSPSAREVLRPAELAKEFGHDEERLALSSQKAPEIPSPEGSGKSALGEPQVPAGASADVPALPGGVEGGGPSSSFGASGPGSRAVEGGLEPPIGGGAEGTQHLLGGPRGGSEGNGAIEGLAAPAGERPDGGPAGAPPAAPGDVAPKTGADFWPFDNAKGSVGAAKKNREGFEARMFEAMVDPEGLITGRSVLIPKTPAHQVAQDLFNFASENAKTIGKVRLGVDRDGHPQLYRPDGTIWTGKQVAAVRNAAKAAFANEEAGTTPPEVQPGQIRKIVEKTMKTLPAGVEKRLRVLAAKTRKGLTPESQLAPFIQGLKNKMDEAKGYSDADALKSGHQVSLLFAETTPAEEEALDLIEYQYTNRANPISLRDAARNVFENKDSEFYRGDRVASTMKDKWDENQLGELYARIKEMQDQRENMLEVAHARINPKELKQHHFTGVDENPGYEPDSQKYYTMRQGPLSPWVRDGEHSLQRYADMWHVKNPDKAHPWEDDYKLFKTEEEARAWAKAAGNLPVNAPIAFPTRLARGYVPNIRVQLSRSLRQSSDLAHSLKSINDIIDAVLVEPTAYRARPGLTQAGRPAGADWVEFKDYIPKGQLNGLFAQTPEMAEKMERLYNGYIHKDVAEFLAGTAHSGSILGQIFRGVEQFARLNQTVRNPFRHPKQLIENTAVALLDDPILAAKTTWEWRNLYDPKSKPRQMVRWLDGKEKPPDLFTEFLSYGFGKESFVDALGGGEKGMLDVSLRELGAFGPEMGSAGELGKLTKAKMFLGRTRPGDAVNRLDKSMKRWYQVEDLYYKYKAYEFHKANRLKELGGAGHEQEAKDYAADRVQKFYFDFENLPPAVKAINHSLVAPFQASVFYNYFRIMHNHMNYGTAHAWQRAGMLAALTSIPAVLNQAFGDDKRELQDKMGGAANQLAYGEVVWKTEDGKYLSFNIGNLMFAYGSLIDNQLFEKGKGSWIRNKLLGLSPVAVRPVAESVLNQNQFGTKIYNEGDAPSITAAKVSDDVLQTFMPFAMYQYAMQIAVNANAQEQFKRPWLATLTRPLVSNRVVIPEMARKQVAQQKRQALADSKAAEKRQKFPWETWVQKEHTKDLRGGDR